MKFKPPLKIVVSIAGLASFLHSIANRKVLTACRQTTYAQEDVEQVHPLAPGGLGIRPAHSREPTCDRFPVI